MTLNGNKSGDDDGGLYDGLDDGLDGGPTDPARLGALRDELKRRDLDGFIQPRSDEHQGEYVARKSERLAWLTGFTGSAGFCVALADVAGVFIDGRYRTQVKAQVADVGSNPTWYYPVSNREDVLTVQQDITFIPQTSVAGGDAVPLSLICTRLFHATT